MEPGLQTGETDPKPLGGSFSAHAFDFAEDVDFPIFVGERVKGVFDAILDAAHLDPFVKVRENRRLFLFQEPENWRHGFLLAQPSANAAADGGEPRPHCFRFAHLIHRTIGRHERLGEDVLSVVVVSAGTGDLAVNGVLMPIQHAVKGSSLGGSWGLDGLILAKVGGRNGGKSGLK